MKAIKINNNRYEFENASWETRNSWGHTSILYKNGERIGVARATYLNRTWESYQYQSCMQSCVENAIKKIEITSLSEYRIDNNITRLSKEKKLEIIKGSREIKDLKKLLVKIS